MSGNPNDHVVAIQGLRIGRHAREPLGSPSLQNALEMARASLYHTPKHGTREVVITMGALLSVDPGDIHETIKSCVKDRLRVQIIGMSGRLKICTEICEKTNSGDEKTYTVALDQGHFRELLLATTTPPVIRKEEELEINKASLLVMGFPSRIEEEVEDAEDVEMRRKVAREEKGASESSRYECQACGSHFCIDCDLFCHEIVHNCPGCLGGAAGDEKLRSSSQLKGKNKAAAVANGHS